MLFYNSGGNPQTRLRNRMRRLFDCTVSLIYDDENGRVTVNSLIADSTAFQRRSATAQPAFAVGKQD